MRFIVAKYNKIPTVSTIVDDSEVEKVSTAITDAVFTGKGEDRIIAEPMLSVF